MIQILAIRNKCYRTLYRRLLRKMCVKFPLYFPFSTTLFSMKTLHVSYRCFYRNSSDIGHREIAFIFTQSSENLSILKERNIPGPRVIHEEKLPKSSNKERNTLGQLSYVCVLGCTHIRTSVNI